MEHVGLHKTNRTHQPKNPKTQPRRSTARPLLLQKMMRFQIPTFYIKTQLER